MSVVDIGWLARKLDRLFKKGEKKSDANGEMLLRKVPLHFGGISDPFASKQITKRSIKILAYLREHDYPVIISTKNTSELVKEEVLSFLKTMKYLVVQVSISAPSNKMAAIVEPRVPMVKERLRCMGILNKEGIYAIARLQPLFVPWIKEIVENIIPELRTAGCKHVIVEFLKIPLEHQSSQLSEVFEKINWNGYDFYREKGAQVVGREWVLPPEYKWELLQPLIEVIHQYGIRYGSGDYGLNHLGDTECCCGIDEVRGFSNWFKGNFATVVRSSTKNHISFSQVMKQWIPNKSIRRYMNSNCRIRGDNGMLAYLRDKWNKPGTVNAPDSLLGVIWSGESDQDGNCIYNKKE